MKDLRAWLKRTPVPVSVRCLDQEDKELKLVTIATKSHTRWKDAAEVIDSVINAHRIEALDVKGSVIRTALIEDDGEETPAANSMEPMEMVVSDDPVVKFAQLLVLVSNQSAIRHEEAHRLGTEALSKAHGMVVDLANTVINQNSEMMKAYQKLSQQLDALVGALQPVPAQAEDPHGGGIMAAVVQAHLAKLAAAAAAPTPKPNGGKVKG